MDQYTPQQKLWIFIFFVFIPMVSLITLNRLVPIFDPDIAKQIFPTMSGTTGKPVRIDEGTASPLSEQPEKESDTPATGNIVSNIKTFTQTILP